MNVLTFSQARAMQDFSLNLTIETYSNKQEKHKEKKICINIIYFIRNNITDGEKKQNLIKFFKFWQPI